MQKGKIISASFTDYSEEEKIAKIKEYLGSLDVEEKQRRVRLLEEMERNLEGFQLSVRAVTKQAERGALQGILGPVSRLISVPDQYSAALEIAFGQSLQNIVVEDEESAKAAIAYLKKKNAGRATFYPITTMRGNELSENDVPAAHRAGFVSVASALVECDDRYRGIVRSLLGRILIAKDIDSANKIAKALNFRYRIVTIIIRLLCKP